MALDAFGGVMTATQIVAAARRRAGSPDVHLNPAGAEALDAPGYVELQMLLDTLALSWEWPFARVGKDVVLQGRITPLPTEFWRMSVDDPIWIVDCNNRRGRLHLADEGVFFDKLEVTGASTARPTIGFFQKSTGRLYVDPVPDQVYTAEIHFQPWRIPLATINDRPWFPWSEYLVEALGAKLGLTLDDQRAASCDQLASRLMKDIRRSLGDQGERTAQIQLNREVYRPPIRL